MMKLKSFGHCEQLRQKCRVWEFKCRRYSIGKGSVQGVFQLSADVISDSMGFQK